MKSLTTIRNNINKALFYKKNIRIIQAKIVRVFFHKHRIIFEIEFENHLKNSRSRAILVYSILNQVVIK